MKRNIQLNQRNTSLDHVLDTYAAALQGKTGIMAGIQTFKDNNARIGQLMSLISRPRKVIYISRRSNAQRLKALTRLIAGMGIHLATAQKDEVKMATFLELRKSATRAGYWQLWQLAQQVLTEINRENEAALTDVGLTTEIQSEFSDLISGFSTSMVDTQSEVEQRLSAHQELKTLMTANHDLMRNNFDPVINLMADTHPDLYRDYRIARRSPISSRSSAQNNEVLADISGNVVRTSDNKPIAGATVMITSLNLNAVTDEDGYYLIEEVPAGNFSLSCAAIGYKVPAEIALTITDGTDQTIDLSLEEEEEKPLA